MICPKCGGFSNCPCKNCIKDNAGKTLWVWDKTGELISCGHCGYTMHADGWQELDAKRFSAAIDAALAPTAGAEQK